MGGARCSSAVLKVIDHFQHLAQFLAGARELASGDQVVAASQEEDGFQDLFGVAKEHDQVLAAGAVVGGEPVTNSARVGPSQAHHDLHRRGTLAVLAPQRLGDRLDEIHAVRIGARRKSFSRI